LLRWALKNKLLTVVIGAAILVVSVLMLLWFVGVEFAPMTEPGEFQITVEMPVGTRLEVTERSVERVEKIVMDRVPELETMFSRVGQGTGFGAMVGGKGSHMGRVRFQVVPLSKRDRSDEEIRRALREPLTQVPGAPKPTSSPMFSLR